MFGIKVFWLEILADNFKEKEFGYFSLKLFPGHFSKFKGLK